MRLGQTHNLRTWLLHLVFFYREKVDGFPSESK
jgi:hypothetical protein